MTNISSSSNKSNLTHGVPTIRVNTVSATATTAAELPGALEPIEFIVDDFMQKSTFNSIIGPSKSGKSMFALQLAFCISNGIPFLGHNCEKHQTLIVDFELKPNEIYKRMEDLKAFYNLEDAEEPLIRSYNGKFSDDSVNIDDVITEVRSDLKKNPDIQFIVFDCFYSWIKGARNQEGNVKKYLQPLKKLSADTGACVSYIHHPPKNIPNGANATTIINAAGGSSIHGKIVDTSYVISPVSDDALYFKVYSVGRACCFNSIDCTKSSCTYYYFLSIVEDCQEFIDIDRDLCFEIYHWLETQKIKSERSVIKQFGISREILRHMGFEIDTKTHSISYDVDKLLLPLPSEEDDQTGGLATEAA